MSFDQKKSDSIEIDELNIKSHLNTSLDIEGISVSEDLINRTLEAIKKQPQPAPAPFDAAPAAGKGEPMNITEQKKVITWTRLIRSLTAVAAACLLIFIGMKSLDFSKKDATKDSARNTELSLTYGIAGNGKSAEAPQRASDTAAGSKASDADSGSMAFDAAVQEGEQQTQLKADEDKAKVDIAANSTEADSSTKQDNSLTMGIASTGEAATAPKEESAYSDIYTLSFRDICPIIPEAVESVSITETLTDNSVFLSDNTDISEFYALMELNSFAEGSESSGVSYYIVKISSEGAAFAITVEDNYILTSYSFGEEKTDSRYVTGNHQQLLQDLGVFYSKFMKIKK